MDLNLSQWLALAVGYGTLPMLVLVGGCFAILAAGLGIARPHLLVLVYLLPLFFFPMSSYGSLTVERAIWGRGSGQLYLPFIVWLLLGVFVAAWFANRFARVSVRTTPVHAWFWAWAALLLVHVATAFALDESAAAAGSALGIREFVTAGILFALMLRVYVDRRSVGHLATALLVLVGVRGVFGLVRFAAFGGDPSNIYANSGGINVKLTFFDINDSLLATMAISLAGWMLYARWRSLGWFTRASLAMLVLLELAVIVFSYRRTAWGGLVLVGLMALALIPIRHRVWAMVVGAPPLLVVLVLAATKRLGKQGSSTGGFFGDMGFSATPFGQTERSYELYLGWRTFLDQPLFGVGTWSGYRGGFAQIAWQQGADAFQFLHSGILHVMVKTGLIGLVLLLGLFGAFLRWAWRNRHQVDDRWRGLYFAGVAGFVFMLPSWALGTPSVEFRTMQLLALCMALPFVAVRASAASIAPT